MTMASLLRAAWITFAPAVCLLSGCTVEQILIGQRYTIRTPQAGACPPLEMGFVVDARRRISGSLSQVGRPGAASLSGVLNPDDSFDIDTAVGGEDRTGKVTGQFTSQVSTIFIRGNAAASACDGQTFHLRLGSYFSRQGGGGGGGG